MVIGGAGFIGSHCARLASLNGHDVSIFDNFSSGHRWACGDFPVFEGDILNTDFLSRCLREIEVVFHCAAKIIVSESVAFPSLYLRNNVAGTESLLRAMTRANVREIVFSSTAAVYGNPSECYVLNENHGCKPVNPYGVSKLRAEERIRSWVFQTNSRATIFRYFNAAGATPELGLGELHEPETHLIPNIVNAMLYPETHHFQLFGDDYPTPDGSCVRDYVHVADIANAHLLALEASVNGNAEIFNLGHGSGFSNFEVMRACESILEQKLEYQIVPRRDGDPPSLLTSNALAYDRLGWVPELSDLNRIISDAIRWHRDVLPDIFSR